MYIYLLFYCVYFIIYTKWTQLEMIITGTSFFTRKDPIIFSINQPLLSVDKHHPTLSFSVNYEYHQLNTSGLTGDGFYWGFFAMHGDVIHDFLSQFQWDSLFKNRLLKDMVIIVYEIMYVTIENIVALKLIPWNSINSCELVLCSMYKYLLT